MRLFELDSLPKKAGVATLVWNERAQIASREEGEITLPHDDNVQFFPLQRGEQFLVAVPDNNRRSEIRLFFGGTDERPFLVEMNPNALLGLKKGESGFYKFIKPDGAKFCEEKFGTKTLRQGDWFAVPIPLSWNAVHGLLGLFCQEHKTVTKKEKGISIGGTRHLLIEGQLVTMDYNHHNCTGIAEGLLRAPDHEDKILKGPHALFQTSLLKEPQKAD